MMEQMALPLQGGRNIAGTSRMEPNPYDYGKGVPYRDKMTGYETAHRLRNLGMPDESVRSIVNLGGQHPVDPQVYKTISRHHLQDQYTHEPRYNPVQQPMKFSPKAPSAMTRMVGAAGRALPIIGGVQAGADAVGMLQDRFQGMEPTHRPMPTNWNAVRGFADGGFIDPKKFAERVVAAHLKKK